MHTATALCRSSSPSPWWLCCNLACCQPSSTLVRMNENPPVGLSCCCISHGSLNTSFLLTLCSSPLFFSDRSQFCLRQPYAELKILLSTLVIRFWSRRCKQSLWTGLVEKPCFPDKKGEGCSTVRITFFSSLCLTHRLMPAGGVLWTSRRGKSPIKVGRAGS